jgi:Na+/proline symporter
MVVIKMMRSLTFSELIVTLAVMIIANFIVFIVWYYAVIIKDVNNMVKSHKQILKQLAKARLKAQTKFKSETQKASSRRIGQQLRRKREGTGKIDG